eukprot:Nk52_evm24s1569 gene=Nk52_evmTU24s1569
MLTKEQAKGLNQQDFVVENLDVTSDEELSASSSARTFLATVSASFIAGIGLIADLYDLTVVNLVKVIMAEDYEQSNSDKSWIASAALIGTVLGMIFFGIMADYIGRKTMFITTATLITIGALGSALSYPIGAGSIYDTLIFWRFVIGFGIGGEYPLSATVTSENSNHKKSGRNMASVYSMMCVGTLLAPCIILLCIAFGASNEFTWRFALAFGAVPSIMGFYLRWNMEESLRFNKVVQHRKNQSQKARFREYVLTLKTYWKPLLATTLAWLMYDVVDYGQGLFQGTITSLMGLGDSITDQTCNTLYLGLLQAPGYAFAIILVNRLGRKTCQLIGFAGMGVLFFVMGIFFDQLQNVGTLFLIIYGVALSFDSFGPGMSTYVIAGEIFPSRVKATCAGMSAASGKVGAIIGTYGFPYFQDSAGLSTVLIFAGGLCIFAFFFTWFMTPNYNSETLKELEENEDGSTVAILYRKRKGSDDSTDSSA